MLTIGKLGASVDQLAYYEQQVAQGLEDYLSGRGESPGRWIGGGCAGIAVSGRVDRDGFMRAMAGCDPLTGAPLRPARGRTRVAAFDLTFSAPKSVSVLFAVGDEVMSSALLEAHERAVAAALAYVEREACFTRRGHAGARRVRGDGFVAAAYRHRLSRAGDPQLHTHVVVANMTRAEGRWTTLEAHGLYEHVLGAGALYRAVLRAEVRERLAWVWWRRVGRGLFEIEGVPDGVLREFSRRRAEIEERVRELTGVGASELGRERLQGIALATRRAKEYGVDGVRWRQEARARAAEHGLGRGEIERLASSPARAEGVSEGELVRGASERLSGPSGLTEKHNTFARRHTLAELAGEFAQGATAEQLEHATRSYLDDESVVCLGSAGEEDRFTTRDLLACEQAIIAGATRRAGERAGLVHQQPPDLIDLLGSLSEEQTCAARTLATDGRGVSVLQALAGTGKTHVLAVLAQTYRAAGYHVVGVAPTGRAARELADAAGIEASTVHRLILKLDEDGGFPARTVVLFDEAGMAPTRISARLFARAEEAGAKVIAVGDAGQLPSVAAGGWFAAVADKLGGPELREAMRQRDLEERKALEALHDGDPDTYLAFKQRRGDIQLHAHNDGAVSALLEQWDHARRSHGATEAVMIARDNSTRARLNELARETLKREGRLGPDSAVIGGREFCVGERVIARRNDRHRDVDNGARATVTTINDQVGALTVEMDTGGPRILDSSYVAENLEHAYAVTGHGAQGATVEWAGVIGRPSEFTAEWAYTALSRAREHTRLHVLSEPIAGRREREQYAPREPELTLPEALEATRQAMRRHEREQLAIEHTEAQQPPAAPDPGALRLPPAESADADAERTVSSRQARERRDEVSMSSRLEPGWRGLRRQRDALKRGPTIGR